MVSRLLSSYIELAGMRRIANTICVVLATSLGMPCAGNVISEKTVTFLGVIAGSPQTLNDVKTHLGESRIWHTGDASTSESKVCYRVEGEMGEVIVVFASNSEMSSPKGQVTSIRVYGKEVLFAAKKRCASLRGFVNELRTPDGLHLGATRAEIAQVLWKRPVSKNNSIHYESCRKQFMQKSDQFFQRWFGKKECFENLQRPYANDCTTVEFQLKSDAAVYFELRRGQSVC